AEVRRCAETARPPRAAAEMQRPRRDWADGATSATCSGAERSLAWEFSFRLLCLLDVLCGERGVIQPGESTACSVLLGMLFSTPCTTCKRFARFALRRL